jgi:sulfatase maturation enzyme AslB (radical SAM superfamily)
MMLQNYTFYNHNYIHCSDASPSAGKVLKNGSNRKLFNDTFLQCYDSTDKEGFVDPSLFKMQRWDLRLSNVCNYGCRMCNSAASSFIQMEQIGDKSGVFIIEQDDDNYKKLKTLVNDHIDSIKTLVFAGGEPMLMKDHWYMLEEIDSRNLYDKVGIFYNINCSTLKYGKKHAFDYWPKFKEIEVACSIDSYGEKAEYIRYGTKWDTVLQNLKDIHSVLGVTRMSCVVTSYSLLYFREFIEYLDANLKDIILNVKLCHGPDWCSPIMLPRSVKQQAIADILSISKDQFKNIRELDGIPNIVNINNIDAMSHESSKSILKARKRFVEWTARLDGLRDESFEQLFPELHSIVSDERFLNDADY